MSIYNPIVTLGLDPEISRIITQGYDPSEVSVIITVISPRGGRSHGRKREEEDRLIRIRVIDEDGKVMIQERLVPLNELKSIKINISESGLYIAGSDIYIAAKAGQIQDGETQEIRVKVYEVK